MTETDDAAAPEPARPILASHLLAVEEKQRARFASRGERVRTMCAEIDEYVLGGGLERGVVVGLSAEGDEGRLVSGLSLRVSAHEVVREVCRGFDKGVYCDTVVVFIHLGLQVLGRK